MVHRSRRHVNGQRNWSVFTEARRIEGLENPSPGIVAFRFKAERLGLTYEEYTLEILERGRHLQNRGCRTLRIVQRRAPVRLPIATPEGHFILPGFIHAGYPDRHCTLDTCAMLSEMLVEGRGRIVSFMHPSRRMPKHLARPLGRPTAASDRLGAFAQS
jgi:hypothetical protein